MIAPRLPDAGPPAAAAGDRSAAAALAPRRWRLLAVALGLASSAVFLWLVLRGADPATILRRAGEADPVWLAASLVTIVGGCLCLTLRAAVLLAPVAVIGRGAIFRSYLVAYLGNAVLPLRFGELLRVDYLARRGDLPRSTALAVVGFERVLDLFWLLVLLTGVAPLLMVDVAGSRSLIALAAVVVVGLAASWGLSRHPERFIAFGRWASRPLGERWAPVVGARWEEFVRGFAALGSPRRLIAVLGWTLAYWLMQSLSVAMWILAFGFNLPWYAAVAVLVVTVLGTAIPSSPGYVGTYDYFSVRALSLFGIGGETAVSFALVSHAVAVVPICLLAAVVLAVEALHRRTAGAPPATIR